MVSPFTLRIESCLTCHRSPTCMRCFRRVIDITEDAQGQRNNFALRQSAPIARSEKWKPEEREEPEEIHYFQRIRVLCKVPEDRGKLMTCNRIWFVLRAWLTFNDTHCYLGTACNQWRHSETAKWTLIFFVLNSERERDALKVV
jgi:hypothetical protein